MSHEYSLNLLPKNPIISVLFNEISLNMQLCSQRHIPLARHPISTHKFFYCHHQKDADTGVWGITGNIKDDIHHAGNAIEAVIKSIQLYFRRGKDSHGNIITKMHVLGKMRDYICEFGSAINFYGGPGQASHKTFMKAAGLETQCRVKEFSTQMAGQYYNIMALNKAFK